MMARSFEKIERRHRGPEKVLVILASKEEVPGAAHGTDKGRMSRVVAQFLTKTADQNVD
jgi:hypothetical protein